MPTYAWTAKDKSGKQVVREITSQTVEDSKAVLIAGGYTDLRLVGDEIIDAANAGFADKITVLGEEVKILAEDRIKHMNKPSPTIGKVLGEGLSQSKGLSLLIISLAFFEAYRGNTTAAVITLAALAAWIVFIIGVGLPGIYYAKLHKAADWNRWTEVLDLVATLKTLGKFHFIKVPLRELMRYRAKALAGLGELPAALEEYKHCENQPGCPSWLYKAFVSGLYDTVKQHDKGLELLLQSIRENAAPALYLDLTNRYLRYHRDPLKAREALAEAEKSTVSEIAKPYHLRCRGILAYLEGDYLSAKRELEASLAIMLRTPHQPGRDGHISMVRAYLSCVLAKQGDLGSAQVHFDQAKEYLAATGELELLAECQGALAAK